MSRMPLVVVAVVTLGACASGPPRSLPGALARMPAARPEEPTRLGEDLARRTLAAAIAAGHVPPERPLVLVRSPFGSARVLPRGSAATFVILEMAEISRLAGLYGSFQYLYLRLEAPEGARAGSIDLKRMEKDETRAEVTLLLVDATPPSDEARVVHSYYAHHDSYEKRDGAWVVTSSDRSDD
jgi:hypothetical protein